MSIISWLFHEAPDAYWDRCYYMHCSDKTYSFGIAQVGDQFFITPLRYANQDKDKGPYGSLEEAQSACFALNRLLGPE